MEKKIKTLVIVDAQFDFTNSSYGSLCVPDAESLIIKIRNLIPDFDHVIFTVDWHPSNHCSFIENGGKWPRHCINYTIGSSIDDSLMVQADSSCESVTVYKKGWNPSKEEYGAFSELINGIHADFYGVEPKALFDISDEIVVCGFAAGYCVNETLLNIKIAGYGDKLFVNEDCIGYLCTKEEFDLFCKDNGINKI